jgi:hypothetical protein
VTVAGVTEGATIIKTNGSYNSRNVLEANSASTTLIASDYTADIGTSLTNYTLPTIATGAASLGLRTLTVGYTGVNRTYDGTDVATVATTDNRVLNDVFTINRNATFADKNVGAGKTISVHGLNLC